MNILYNIKEYNGIIAKSNRYYHKKLILTTVPKRKKGAKRAIMLDNSAGGIYKVRYNKNKRKRVKNSAY